MMEHQAPEERGRARLEAKVRIRILGVDATDKIYTGNISKDGIFIETHHWKPRLGHPVSLLITLDPDQEPVKFSGTVMRVIGPNQWGKPEGVAIEFTKIESRKTKDFDLFLDGLFEGKGLGCRKTPRANMQIDVEIKTKEDAVRVLSHDLSQGGAFLKMDTQGMELEMPLSIVLIHPTSKRKFILKAQVVHIRKGSTDFNPDFVEGIGVKFVDLSEIRSQDLKVFLKSIVSSKRRKKKSPSKK